MKRSLSVGAFVVPPAIGAAGSGDSGDDIISSVQYPWVSAPRPVHDTTAESLYGCLYVDSCSEGFVNASEALSQATDITGAVFGIGIQCLFPKPT